MDQYMPCRDAASPGWDRREVPGVADEAYPTWRAAAQRVKPFVPHQQFDVMRNAAAREGLDGGHYQKAFVALDATIKSMPKVYEQDGAGEDAIAHLHYFGGSADIYVTEKDMDDPGTAAAFGQADLGFGPEMGYLSIQEYVEHAGVNLDLHFEPSRLADINNSKQQSNAGPGVL